MEMQKKLEELALSKVGEVMIFELVQYVQVSTNGLSVIIIISRGIFHFCIYLAIRRY